ncbi:hypothetical protein DXG03_006395 [Asterophora parasitica]|uniref:Uncharacterized protein n=1 Tax=Asterophora parasitica TaxID=117018 RepID=A0A9P7GAU1_9AGAR|nr:hypothetical protein DXG03_006395 [Asterophora parasitica]
MSDADRAAKAARAKAMLKKRQREKAGGATVNSGAASPVTPSRTSSPAPQLQEPPEEDKRDLGDVFTKDDSDTSWLSSLPRAPTPPPRVTSTLPSAISPQPSAIASPHPLAVSSPPPDQHEYLSNQLAALQAENTTLSAEVKQLQAAEAKAKQLENLLVEKINQINALQTSNTTLSDDVKRLKDAESKAKRSETIVEEQRVQLNTRIDTLESESAELTAEVERLQDAELKARQTETLLDGQRTRSRELEEQLHHLEVEKERALQNEQQTISLLVSEKSSLLAEVERLGDIESKASALQSSLEEARVTLRTLNEQVERLQADRKETATVIQLSQAKEKELTERCREKERELHLATSSLNDSKHDAEQSQRRIRELEEQIQNDDRVERLENSLKNTQDRADELEFQLSKLKQAHTMLKADRDALETKHREHSSTASELEVKLSELQGVHTGILEQLATVTSERTALAEEKSEIAAQGDSTQKSLSEVQEKLVQASATIASNSRQLQTVQNQLKAATRRADDAEKTQQNLQAEGTNLMRSLDEMRPKIVELTGAKLELTETISSLERDLRNTRDTISHLESSLKSETEANEDLQTQLQDRIAQHDKERSLAVSDSSELQKAYTDLQEELNAATASLSNLEAERAGHHQETVLRLEEIDRLAGSSRAQADELTALHAELDRARQSQDESQEFIDNAQNEIESLRTDLSAREDEVAQLREAAASPTRTGAPQSLDDELLRSLRQQHALDLSSAQSQVRALENSVYDANARAHALQKQVSALEDQLARPRPSSRLGQRSFSPVPSGLRPASRSSDLRRSSIGSHQPPLVRSIFDQNMSAETRHKRLVSLSMLKARIDSEADVPVSRPSSRASSVRGLSPVRSVADSHHSQSHSRPGHRPQFLDDSHVFWCHSCTGDLVIL